MLLYDIHVYLIRRMIIIKRDMSQKRQHPRLNTDGEITSERWIFIDRLQQVRDLQKRIGKNFDAMNCSTDTSSLKLPLKCRWSACFVASAFHYDCNHCDSCKCEMKACWIMADAAICKCSNIVGVNASEMVRLQKFLWAHSTIKD